MLPNLIIPGAPKCGTTAIYEYLRAHPDVFMCTPKEPNYFAGYLRPDKPISWIRYCGLFSAAESYRYRGDASTNYLLSRTAIPQIEEALECPKYIVCVRNPTDLAISLHRQRLLQGFEDVESFQKAWRLIEKRRSGESPLPAGCPHPELLFYDENARIGSQIELMLEVVEWRRILLIFLEDLRTDPKEEYKRILDFLNLKNDGRTEFDVVNPASVRTWPRLHRLVLRVARAKNRVGIGYCGEAINRLYDKLTVREARGWMEEEDVREELVAYFEDEVEKIERIAGRPFLNRNISEGAEKNTVSNE